MDAVYLDLDGTLLSFARPYPRLPAAAFESVVGEARDDWVETYLGGVGEYLDRCVRGPCRRAFADVADEFDLEADHVESVVTSYDAGAPKPDPAPYRLAEELLPADGYLMVGDPPSDVEGAEAAGWAAHRFEGDSFEGLPAVVREAFEE